MRIAVLSDLHGNLEALLAFKERIDEQDVDRICCLGDIVGYGPDPNECVELVRSLPKINVTLGNHDWAACNPNDISFDMSPVALEAIQWTSSVLTGGNREYLMKLEPTLDMGPFTFVHSSAHRPLKWQYLKAGKTFSVWMCMRAAAGRIVFTGHTHVPLILDGKGRNLMSDSDFSDGTTFTDDGSKRILVNPGSLGQPRDRIVRPSYVIYDTRTGELTWHRILRYDCHVTIGKIVNSGLPVQCAWLLLA